MQFTSPAKSRIYDQKSSMDNHSYYDSLDYSQQQHKNKLPTDQSFKYLLRR